MNELPLLPTINASLNLLATFFLLAGWVSIRRDRSAYFTHRNLMVAALVASTLFLACYLYYHYTAGSVRYQGEGILRYVYFFVLITHVPLAALMVPFILAAVWFAFRRQFARHVRITRWLWPVWMYVSVTGVVIYVMLYLMGGNQG